ncbi:MAG: hypothetical protein SFY92_04030 [Verrucomicrobiae bacterium]|nr:hypothetical protein [Verrucomicrobiae bacterium]
MKQSPQSPETDGKRGHFFWIFPTAIIALIIMGLFVMISARENPKPHLIYRMADRTLMDARMIESASESYAIENGLSLPISVSFDSLVTAGYFKHGSNLEKGFPPFPATHTYGVYYRDIDPTTMITVPMELRKGLVPHVPMNDPVWENGLPRSWWDRTADNVRDFYRRIRIWLGI